MGEKEGERSVLVDDQTIMIVLRSFILRYRTYWLYTSGHIMDGDITPSFRRRVLTSLTNTGLRRKTGLAEGECVVNAEVFNVDARE